MEEKKEETMTENAPSEKIGGEEEKNMEHDKDFCRKKMKNYTSIIILLAGLLIGSVFVDIAQFFGQQGISPRVLKTVDVFPFEGKTWVAYNEPVVNLQVLTDSKCEACDPIEPLKWLKRVIPTMLAKKVEVESNEGADLMEKLKIKSIPAFVFDENITKTDVYGQAQAIFTKKDGSYVMNTEQVGISPGKFIETPSVLETDPQAGPKDAKVKVVLYSDFQCPYCKTFYGTYKMLMTEYKDRVLFSYKHLPLDFHAQAMNAALAADCAGEQGKFWEMADRLYTTQDTWGKTEGTQSFKSMTPSLGINSANFNKCLDDSKYKDQIEADKKSAGEFGISGTPAVFVDDQFFGGVVSQEELKKVIDAELAK